MEPATFNENGDVVDNTLVEVTIYPTVPSAPSSPPLVCETITETTSRSFNSTTTTTSSGTNISIEEVEVFTNIPLDNDSNTQVTSQRSFDINQPTIECYICKDESSREELFMQTCACKAIVHKSCLDLWTLMRKVNRVDECSICRRSFHLIHKQKKLRAAQLQDSRCFKCFSKLKQILFILCCNTCSIVVLYLGGLILLALAFLAFSWLFGWLVLGKACPWEPSGGGFVCILLRSVLGSVIVGGAIFVLVLLCAPVVCIVTVLVDRHRRKKRMNKNSISNFVMPLPADMLTQVQAQQQQTAQ